MIISLASLSVKLPSKVLLIATFVLLTGTHNDKEKHFKKAK